jgi:TctA family transporter
VSDETEVTYGEPVSLTQDEIMWLDIRKEMTKATPGRVVDSLTRLMAMGAALSVGALAAFKDDVVMPWARVWAAMFFFAALLVAALGASTSQLLLPEDPDDIRQRVGEAVDKKEICARVSLAFIAVGIFIAIVGAFIRTSME